MLNSTLTNIDANRYKTNIYKSSKDDQDRHDMPKPLSVSTRKANAKLVLGIRPSAFDELSIMRWANVLGHKDCCHSIKQIIYLQRFFSWKFRLDRDDEDSNGWSRRFGGFCGTFGHGSPRLWSRKQGTVMVKKYICNALCNNEQFLPHKQHYFGVLINFVVFFHDKTSQIVVKPSVGKHCFTSTDFSATHVSSSVMKRTSLTVSAL